jgi:translation initiation factor 1
MAEICPKCGLPKELCTCDVREREVQKIRVLLEKRKWGKSTTIVEGVTENGKELVKNLKSKLACGGTYKNGLIELQGDHRPKIKELLVKFGYEPAQIEVI